MFKRKLQLGDAGNSEPTSNTSNDVGDDILALLLQRHSRSGVPDMDRVRHLRFVGNKEKKGVLELGSMSKYHYF